MTQEQLSVRMIRAIKAFGVNGFYMYFETPIELKDGTKINEVRISTTKPNAVECLEYKTNKVVKRIAKKDLLKIYDRM